MSTLLVLSAVGNLGKKGTIMVVHHSDCGLQSVGEEEIKESLRNCVANKEERLLLEGIKFGAFEE